MLTQIKWVLLRVIFTNELPAASYSSTVNQDNLNQFVQETRNSEQVKILSRRSRLTLIFRKSPVLTEIDILEKAMNSGNVSFMLLLSIIDWKKMWTAEKYPENVGYHSFCFHGIIFIPWHFNINNLPPQIYYWNIEGSCLQHYFCFSQKYFNLLQKLYILNILSIFNNVELLCTSSREIQTGH